MHPLTQCTCALEQCCFGNSHHVHARAHIFSYCACVGLCLAQADDFRFAWCCQDGIGIAIGQRLHVRVNEKQMLPAGVLLDKTDSWSVIFGAVAVVYALGFTGFALLGSGELQ